jgi:hypothetical protein
VVKDSGMHGVSLLSLAGYGIGAVHTWMGGRGLAEWLRPWGFVDQWTFGNAQSLVRLTGHGIDMVRT